MRAIQATIVSLLGVFSGSSFAQGWADMPACRDSNLLMCNSFEGGACGKSWEPRFETGANYWAMNEFLWCTCSGGVLILGPCGVYVSLPESNPPLEPYNPPPYPWSPLEQQPTIGGSGLGC